MASFAEATGLVKSAVYQGLNLSAARCPRVASNFRHATPVIEDLEAQSTLTQLRFAGSGIPSGDVTHTGVNLPRQVGTWAQKRSGLSVPAGDRLG
jgi:hypothetical protein